MIHISRDGRILGQYSEEEVQSGLQEGRFFPADLAWREGMETWKPLSEVLNLAIPPLPNIGSGDGAVVEPAEEVLAEPESSEPMPAWERRKSIGFFKALFESIREIVAQPSKTFAQMPSEGGVGGPLLFQLIMSWAASGVAIIYHLITMMINPSSALKQELQGLSFGNPVGVYLIVFLTLMPIVIVFGSFISAALLHFALMIVGGAKKPFEATMRVYCYAIGGTSVFYLIPLCGGLLCFFWSWVLIVMGLVRVHKIDYARGIIAVFLVLILFCGFVAAIGLIGALVLKDLPGVKPG